MNDDIIYKNVDERGFAPRLFESLCSMIEEQKSNATNQIEFEMRCSFLEI